MCNSDNIEFLSLLSKMERTKKIGHKVSDDEIFTEKLFHCYNIRMYMQSLTTKSLTVWPGVLTNYKIAPLLLLLIFIKGDILSNENVI